MFLRNAIYMSYKKVSFLESSFQTGDLFEGDALDRGGNLTCGAGAGVTLGRYWRLSVSGSGECSTI